MAIKPKDAYAGQVDETDASYPDGKAQNDLVEGDGFGTPLEQGWVNDLFGFQQALLKEAGIAASGTPDKVGASQYLQAIQGIGGAISAMRDWRTTALPVTDSGRNCLFPILLSLPLPPVGSLQPKQRAIVAFGYDAADSNRTAFIRSFGTSDFESSVQVTGTTTPPTCAAGGAAGELFGALNGNSSYIRTSLASVLAGPYTSATPVSALHYMPGANVYLVARTNGDIDRYAGALASQPTGAPYNAVASGATVLAASGLGFAGGDFADNGANTVVFLTSSTVGGVSRFRVFRSTNAGTSWTIPLTLDAAVTAANVAWHAAAGVFVLWSSDGLFYTSPDGTTWTPTGPATGVTVTNGASARANTLAIQGSCVAKVFSPAYYSGPVAKAGGVAFSFDLCQSWRIQHIADKDGFGPKNDLRTLIAANGRFYASDMTRVFRSGVVSNAAADF